MSDDPADSPELFSREARMREAVLTDFEAAWFRGERPDIAEYLSKNVEPSPELLRELVHVDLEFRCKQGEAPRIEQYFGRFPELADDAESLLALAAAEYDLRRRQADDVSIHEFTARFPEIAPQLRDLAADPASPQATDAAEPLNHGRARLTIAVISGPHRGLNVTTDEHSSFIVGRGSEAQIQLIDDPHFSRYHLRLEFAPPHCRLTDLDSRNGTFVNGCHAKSVMLQDGDVLSGGSTRMLISIQPAAGASAERISESAVEAHVSPPAKFPSVPGYRLERRLGSGVIGEVYQAVHEESGQAVAIKLIRTSHPEARQPMLQFIRQMSRLSELRHAGIVELHEAGLAEGRPFLATEFVDTIPVEKVLQAERAGQRDRLVCRVVIRLLDALQHAHRQSLVHGSIKPSNVLFTAQDRSLTVKLSDFGLSSIWMNAHLSSISPKSSVDDLAFMPPEQVRDCRAVSAATDIYSTGILLYSLLCGELPFAGTSEQQVFEQILNSRLIPLSDRRPDLVPRLTALVHRAVARNPTERFPAATDMQQELQQIIA